MSEKNKVLHSKEEEHPEFVYTPILRLLSGIPRQSSG